MNKLQSTKYKAPSSNYKVLTFVVVKSNLVLVRSIFKRLVSGLQANTPSACDHLSAHFIFRGRTKRHIGEVGILHQLLFDFVCIDAKTLSQIFARFLYRFFFAYSHSKATPRPGSLNLQTTHLHFLFRRLQALCYTYFVPQEAPSSKGATL